MNPRNRGSLKARTDTDQLRKDPTFAGKRTNPGASADHFRAAQADHFRDRNQNSESMHYELGGKPADAHWNPMRGSYQQTEGKSAEARVNPITWDGQSTKESKAPRDSFKPSTQLQLQNFRKSGLMQEEYDGPTVPNSPKRALRAQYASDREMLSWAPESAPPSQGNRRAPTTGNSSANTAELLKWSEKRSVEVQPSNDSPSRPAVRNAHLRDMSGEQTKTLMAHAHGAPPVDEGQKKRQPLVQTREELNQRKFDQLTSAMTVNKQMSDTYNQLFKARDRNAQGQQFQIG
jgi:hypothetical protein